ncbi:MAG: hypothetical protein QOH57_3680 [Mycobacterium sp.]|jgi:hypothetical protein|nr:hypothetical protein [Mycobacterium sp.]
MSDANDRNVARLRIFLRIYGVLSLLIFIPLFLGFMVESPLLAEHGGALNWTIWNDVRFGAEHAHVPPMLFAVYIVWGVFLLRASRNPLAYGSFLNFTMWTNAVHSLLMAGQALMDMDRYWSKFLTDIPFLFILAAGIYLWGPRSLKGQDLPIGTPTTRLRR